MQNPRPRTPKKLLVASLGVATVSYVAFACSSSSPVVTGHDDAGVVKDAAFIDEFPVANLVALPMDSGVIDTGATGAGDAGTG